MVRDAFGGYEVPLVLTFFASSLQLMLMLYLMRADASARASPSGGSTLGPLSKAAYGTLDEAVPEREACSHAFTLADDNLSNLA